MMHRLESKFPLRQLMLLRLFLWALLVLCSSGAVAQTQVPSYEMPPRSITVVMDDNYPPFIFRDATGKLQGILQDTWALWEKHTGITVKLHAMDWSQALRAMQAGQADVIDTIFDTEARKQIYDFSAPYAQLDVPLFFHQSISGIVNADSLKGFTVGVKAGDACIDVLHAHGVDSIQVYPSYSVVIAAAAASEVRVFCVDRPPAVYLLNQLGIEKEFRHSAPLYTGNFHRAVRKGNGALLKVVEDGFARISAAEHQKIQQKWFGTAIEGPGLSTSAPYAAFALLGVVLLAIALALWNRMLQRLVKEKTAELSNSLAALSHEKQVEEQALAQMNTAQEALRESERQLSESQNIACLGSYVFDIADGLWKSSEILDNLFGIDAVYVRSLAGWEALIHPDDRQMMDSYFKDKVLGQKQVFDKVYRIVRHDDQSPRWVHGLGKLEFDAAAGLVKMFGTIQDITESKAAQEQIQNLAFSDPLTGLPNRRLLLDRLEQALTASIRHQRQGALLFIDLDDFKTLNETLGHEKGDLLLQQVSQRLLTCVREGDTVARLGGDEFVVLLEDLSQNLQEAASQAEAVGKKILNALNQPYQLGQHAQHSTSSIGITLFGGTQREAIAEPLKRAELAMYQAKAAGRNTLRFFEAQMQAAVMAHAALETSLRQALAKNQFLLYYQAQVTDAGQISGVEALVRWLDPERGIVLPAEFIGLAEETGLILPLGQWVLETACKQLTLWASQPALAHLGLAVNVSASQFHQSDFVAQVLAALARSGARPERLKLELTESLLVANIEDVIAKMSALKSQSVGFSLDDFGTGYSSLSYLKRLPLDQLKIDSSFVRDILTNPSDAAIAKTVIDLAQNLGLAVIAEGVEIAGQRDLLARQGCHAYQGYLFSRPLPLAEFEAFAKGA